MISKFRGGRMGPFWRSQRLPQAAALALVIALGGCETPVPGETNLTQGLGRLATGLSGYQGEVRPITSAINLEYGEVTDARITMKTVTRTQDGAAATERSNEVAMKWTARHASQNSIFDIRVAEYKEARGTLAPRQPLIQMIVLASRDGADVRDVSVAFPGVKELGRPEPTRDSEVYKSFVKIAERAFVPFARSIRQAGDPVYSKDLADMIAQLIDAPLTEADRRSMTMRGGISAVGLTTVRGRLSLLAPTDGTIAMSEGARFIEIRMEGFQAVDLVTGLVNDGLARVRVESRMDGVPQRSIDTISSFSTTY